MKIKIITDQETLLEVDVFDETKDEQMDDLEKKMGDYSDREIVSVLVEFTKGNKFDQVKLSDIIENNKADVTIKII